MAVDSSDVNYYETKTQGGSGSYKSEPPAFRRNPVQGSPPGHKSWLQNKSKFIPEKEGQSQFPQIPMTVRTPQCGHTVEEKTGELREFPLKSVIPREKRFDFGSAKLAGPITCDFLQAI